MFDERFARQYRYEPPSGFPLTSPYTGIVHHLSGPNRYALAQSSGYNLMSACAEGLTLGTFHVSFAYRFITSTLAYMLDSLVRVSRRDGGDHCHKIVRRPLKPSDASLGVHSVTHKTPANSNARFHPVFQLPFYYIQTPDFAPSPFKVREN